MTDYKGKAYLNYKVYLKPLPFGGVEGTSDEKVAEDWLLDGDKVYVLSMGADGSLSRVPFYD